MWIYINMNQPFGSLGLELGRSLGTVTTPSPELSESKKSGILGPILSGDTVYIAVYGGVNEDQVPVFLGLPTQSCVEGNDDMLIAIGSAETANTLSQATEYRVNADKNPITGSTTFTFTNTKSGRNISVVRKDDKIVLVEGAIPATFTLDQTTFSSWSTVDNDVVALSFVNYNLNLQGGGDISTCGNIKCTVSECIEANEMFPLGPIVLVPSVWLKDCDGGDSQTETSIKASYCSAFCAFTDLADRKSFFSFFGCGTTPKGCTGSCFCAGEPILGFTSQTDCRNEFRYKYCKIPGRCNGSCQSACPQEDQVCIYTESSTAGMLGGKSGVYTCVATGTTGTHSGTGCFIDLDCCPSPIGCDQVCVKRRCQKREIPEKEEEIIIIVGSVLGILVLGIIIFVAYVYSSPKKKG